MTFGLGRKNVDPRTYIEGVERTLPMFFFFANNAPKATDHDEASSTLESINFKLH